MPAAISIKADEPWLRPTLVASWREIVLVILLLIGPAAWHSACAAWMGSSSHYISLLLTDSRMWSTGAKEGVMLAFFLVFLHWRGWKPADFRIQIGFWSSLQGLPLVLAMTLANLVTVSSTFFLLFKLQSKYAHFLPFVAASNGQVATMHDVVISWFPMISAMILNAFFEELICMGYIFNQLAMRLGPALALFITVLLRMSCHTYQGGVHVLGIGVVFLISGLWYWRTRNLWTLIFAHALLDIGMAAAVKLVFSHHH